MMNTKLDYKKVIGLENLKFNIPSYQRGYRWNIKNVEQFLNDIYEDKIQLIKELLVEEFKTKDEIDTYFKNKSEYKYCIQPLVIKENNGIYNVIDGQQRLTTIFIMIAALKELKVDILNEFKLFINYESRDRSEEFLNFLLKDTDEKKNLDTFEKEHKSIERNIDFEYMEKAFECAVKYFKGFLVKNKLDNTTKSVNSLLLILLYCCEFIWYPMNENDEENEIKWFSKINMGKVKLRDVDIIKAEFMNPKNYTYEGKKLNYSQVKSKQISISEKWYGIETELHKPDFWAFIPHKNQYKEIDRYETRIDILFHFFILENYLEKNKSNTIEKYICEIREEMRQEYFLYNKVKEIIDNEKHETNDRSNVIDKCWEKLKDIFENLKELYEDDGRELINKNTSINTKENKNQNLYNLISFLIYISSDEQKNGEYTHLKIYYDLYEILKTNRKNRIEIVKEKIRIKVNEMLEIDERKKLKNAIQALQYEEGSNNSKISNILLLYNIILLNNAPGIGNRYNFLRHRSEKWSIEHIFAQNQEVIATNYQLIEDIKKKRDDVKGIIEKYECEMVKNKNQLKNVRDNNNQKAIKVLEEIEEKIKNKLTKLKEEQLNSELKFSRLKISEEERLLKERKEILKLLTEADEEKISNKANEIIVMYSILDEIRGISEKDSEIFNYIRENKDRIKHNLGIEKNEKNKGNENETKEEKFNSIYQYILFLNLLKCGDEKYSKYIDILRSVHRIKFCIQKSIEMSNNKETKKVFEDIFYKYVKEEFNIKDIEEYDALHINSFVNKKDKQAIYNNIKNNIKSVIDKEIKSSIVDKKTFFMNLNKKLKIEIEVDENILGLFPEQEEVDANNFESSIEFINEVKEKIKGKVNTFLVDDEAYYDEKTYILEIEKDIMEKKINDFFESEYNNLLKDNSIKNLTLLSPKINHDIGNKPYMDKKVIIYDSLKKGEFIPLATIFVFTDLYTRDMGIKLQWLLESRTEYEKDILKTICNFFGEKEKEDE